MFCNVNHNSYSLFPAGEDEDGGSGGVLTQQPHLAELSHVTASNVQQVCFAGGRCLDTSGLPAPRKLLLVAALTFEPGSRSPFMACA